MSNFARQVKQSSYGLRELEDFINIFNGKNRVVSELTLPNRRLTDEELDDKYPHARKLQQTYCKFRDFLKHTGTRVDKDSVIYRTPHLTALKETLKMVSRMQFSVVANGVINALLEENVGWAIWSYEVIHKEDGEVETVFKIGDDVVDLTKDIEVSIIGRNGRIVTGLVITDLNKNKVMETYNEDGTVNESKYIPNPALRLTESSYGNQDVIERMRYATGSVAENDPGVHFALSPLDALVMRIENEENKDKYLSNLDTVALEDLDYHPDISFIDYSEYLELYHRLKDSDQLYNSLDYAFRTLFRWGIITPDSWETATKTIDAVMQANKEAGEGGSSIYDDKLVEFVYQEFSATNPDGTTTLPPLDNLNLFLKGADYIPTLAGGTNAAIVIFPALMLREDGSPEIATLAVQTRSNVNRTITSNPRTSTDLRAIVRLKSKDDWEIIDDFVSPAEVICIAVPNSNTHVVQYNVERVGSNSTGSALTEEQKEYRKRLLKLNEDMTLIRDDLRARGLLG